MYEQYYGLRERPFDLSPNPRFLFLSEGHREALTHLRYGLTGRPGLTVIVGEAGTGKTTLVRAALQTAGSDTSTMVHLANPTLTRSEFYEFLASGFGFSTQAAASKTRFLAEIEQLILARERQHGVLALVVDEAQSLPHELLEEIRLLTNTEVRGRSLAVALVGQPELAARLNDPSLRQLKQRIALRCLLSPLTLPETAAYIAARVRIAGGSAETMFTRDAVIAIYERSRGIPRTISVICDNSLVNGFAASVRPVGRDFVIEVCRDFDFVAAPGGGASGVRREPAPIKPAAIAHPGTTPRPPLPVPPTRDSAARDGKDGKDRRPETAAARDGKDGKAGKPETAPVGPVGSIASGAAATPSSETKQDSKPQFANVTTPRRFSFF
ncbi:MAG TPA: AAA family ATPase [Vicinamibacterales bacterium]|jgi:general secretion pathway protein A|nr:AAA family ATPase [Vicinamibacterales bacterium]